jgi:hypothetical protein
MMLDPAMIAAASTGCCAYRKSNASILVMQSTQDRTAQTAASAERDIGASLFNDR